MPKGFLLPLNLSKVPAGLPGFAEKPPRLAKGFLRRRKLDFRRSLSCDVPTGAIYKLVFLNTDPRNPTVTAILASIAIGETDCRLTNHSQLKAGPRVLHIIRMQQLEDRHARDFFFRPSEDGLPRRVGGLKISLGIESPEQVGT